MLDAVSDPQAADYPYGEMGVQQRDRSLAGGRLTPGQPAPGQPARL